MPQEESALRERAGAGLIMAFALAALAFHLAVNAFGGYGIFRDEFYYIACSKRLAAGYVDQPPLAMFLMAAGRKLFGVSQLGLRVLPAVAHSLMVLLTGLIARRLGGRRLAVALACLAVLTAPIIVGHTNIFQMNAFSHLFWAAAAYLIVLIVERSRPTLWLLLGLVIGLGLLNKIDFLWFGAGLAAALLLTDMRKDLATPWPYAAAGLALLVFSPFIVWNATHGFAHLEFIRNATAGKYAGLTRLDFLSGQLLLLNPVNLAFWLPGLLFLLFGREGRRYRALGVVFLVAFAILLANPHSKAEYLGPAYGMLFAAGGVFWERWAARGRQSRKAAVAGLAAAGVLSSLVLLPFAVPVLPVATFINYAAALGIEPDSAESKELSALPQFYADMFGWEDLARDVSSVYLTLPPGERAATVVLARNYGQAGALEYYAARYPLPRVISAHNSYWVWGYPDRIGTMILIGGDAEHQREHFDEVVPAAVHRCRYCMPYENNLPILVCRGPRFAMADLWKAARGYN